MAEEDKSHRRHDRYGYRYYKNADSYSKRREEKTQYHSDAETEPESGSRRQRRPSPPHTHLEPVESVVHTRSSTRERRAPSPPALRLLNRSASTGHASRSERPKVLGGSKRPPKVEDPKCLAPESSVPQRHHERDAEAPSPTFVNTPLVPSINIIAPDEQVSDARSTRSGRSWSRNPGSDAERERSNGPSLPPSSSSGFLGDRIYRYSELRPLELRLVRIMPAKMAAIKCTIDHYSLAEPPNYVAISYAWGDADDKRQIQINGVKIDISASLAGALSAVREKGNDVLVWADALCIDQQNSVEKSDQIKMMTKIFAKANSVAIWLGPEANNSGPATEFLKDLRVRAESEQQIKSLITSSTRQRDLAAVAALFSRSYWSRVWVVQEVFNASAINVYCGSTKLPWHVFKTASNIFWRYREDLDYQFSTISQNSPRYSMLPNSFTHAQALVYEGPNSLLDRQILQVAEEETLLNVLRACRRKLSVEPRDKVFALLGVLPDSVRSEFPVDYKDSVKEIFTNVVDFLISTTESLDVICESIHFPKYSNYANLPSWVPDWSHNPETMSMSQSYGFSAAGNTHVQWRFPDARLRNELEISAIYLDTIQQHGIPVGTLCTLADYLMAFLHWRALLIQKFGRLGQGTTSNAAHEAFCRTLNLDQIRGEWKDRKTEWMQACNHVFASLLKDRMPYLALDPELEAFITADVNVGHNSRRQFLQNHFGKHMMGRSFCITNGKRMGMGSGFMLPSDIVVVPLGCRTPIILREEGSSPGKYRFVGDVYIDKYMHGRAIDMYQAHEREIEKFVLI